MKDRLADAKYQIESAVLALLTRSVKVPAEVRP